MIKIWSEGAHVVWALREDRRDEPFIVRVSALAFYKFLFWVTGASETQIDLSRADFFLLDRLVVDAINACPERNTSLFGLISWLGFKQGSVSYRRRARRHGRSGWSLRSRLRLAKDWVVSFSGLPLKMMTAVGILVAISGFVYAMYVMINMISGSPVPGWSSLIVAVLLLGGIQMIMLGVTGEYLWRNLDESRRRPIYFIEKRTGKDR